MQNGHIEVGSRIAELIAPLVADRDQLVAARDEARAKVKAIEAEIATVDRMLRAAGHAPVKARAKAAHEKRVTAPAKRVTKPVLEVVAIVAANGEAMTSREVAEASGRTRSSADGLLRAARDLGLLRNAGKKRPEGGSGQSAVLYAPLPDTARKVQDAEAALA